MLTPPHKFASALDSISLTICISDFLLGCLFRLTSFLRMKTSGSIVCLYQAAWKAIKYLLYAHTNACSRAYTHTQTHTHQLKSNGTTSPEAICEIRGYELTQRASKWVAPSSWASVAYEHTTRPALSLLLFFLPLTSPHLASSCLIPHSYFSWPRLATSRNRRLAPASSSEIEENITINRSVFSTKGHTNMLTHTSHFVIALLNRRSYLCLLLQLASITSLWSHLTKTRPWVIIFSCACGTSDGERWQVTQSISHSLADWSGVTLAATSSLS